MDSISKLSNPKKILILVGILVVLGGSLSEDLPPSRAGRLFPI